MKQKTYKIIRLFLIVVFVAILVFIGLKSCVYQVYLNEDEIQEYSIVGDDLREMKIFLMPKNEALIYYNGGEFEEIVSCKLNGTYGINYVSNFWAVFDRGSAEFTIFDILKGKIKLKTYGKESKPVFMYIKIKDKYFKGKGESTFPKAKEQMKTIIETNPRYLVFYETKLTKKEPDYNKLDEYKILLEK